MKKKILYSILVSVIVAGTLFTGCGTNTVTQTVTETPLAVTKTVTTENTTKITQLEQELAAALSGWASANNTIDLYGTKVLRNPTYDEAVAFMMADLTTEIDHTLGVMRIANNAAKAGWQAYWVVVKLKESSNGYNFIGFNTTDKGWVYFVGGNIYVDRVVSLIVGQKLTKLNPFFSTLSFNDTILEILTHPLIL